MLKTAPHYSKEIMKNIDIDICKDILKDITANFDIYEACVELYLKGVLKFEWSKSHL